jgi:hypothetical protein
MLTLDDPRNQVTFIKEYLTDLPLPHFNRLWRLLLFWFQLRFFINVKNNVSVHLALVEMLFGQ